MSTLYNAKHWKVPVPPLPKDVHVKADEFLKTDITKDGDGTSNSSSGKKKKIIIVGAGVAGLFAAYTLEYLGITNYEILEASSMTGGRFYSTDKLQKNDNDEEEGDGFELDLGAEWCHVNPRILQDLLLFDDQVVDDPTAIGDDRLFTFHPKTYTFQTKHGEPVRRDMMRYVYQEYKFKSTTWGDYLNDYVLSKIDRNKIRLNTPVKHVDYSSAVSDGGTTTVNVTTADGTVWKADKVIVAVSLGVMKDEGLLQFTPKMPSIQRTAIQTAEWGHGLKIMIQFQQRFYTDFAMPNPLIELSDHDLVGFYDAVYNKDTTKHILGVAVVGTEGRSTKLACTMDDETDIVREILDMLDALYDGQASRYYIRHDMINWSKMPYIQGAYSHITVPELSKTIGLPLADTVYFAGEHVSEHHIGYMHGSAITGRRAAVMALGGEAMKIEGCRLSLQDCINN